MTATIALAFTLNGTPHRCTVPPEMRLTDILREQVGLTATKIACGVGRCGACTVFVNGLPINGCLLMAWQVDGAAIVSPEGLDVFPEALILRRALAQESAFQCGYCAPGFTVVLTALLRDNPRAGEAEIRAALEGNLCRCTGYHSIIRGALAAVDALRLQQSAGRPGEPA